jgi:replicative DNA helicase
MLNQAAVAKVPFPPFMQELNDMFVGGLPLGHIVNIAADTGIGKTTLVNELIKFWVFNSPHLVGIVSMELDAGQYGEVLLSQHIGKKLSLISSTEDKLEYIKSDRVKAMADELFKNGDEPRFYLLDNRDGSVEEIQDIVEELVVACGCKIIVLDPLQDILDGLTNEEQAVFMKWMKGFIKSHGVTFVLINHMRKTPAGQNGADSEQNIMGSSTIIKSASGNILLKRDKMAEDPVVRNTTEILVSKNRICGLTGPAGAVYYNNETHRLQSLKSFLEGQPSD